MLSDCRRGDAQTSVQNAQRHPAMAAICHCICILQLAFNDYRKESKILRRVRYVMNILPSFSPYPSSSLPLTKTGKKGTARDNEQKKSKIMVAETEGRAAKRAPCGARRAAGGAREDEADRRPPLWFRLPRRIPQRGRAPHAMLTHARRPLRLRVGRFGHHLPTEAAMPRNADAQN